MQAICLIGDSLPLKLKRQARLKTRSRKRVRVGPSWNHIPSRKLSVIALSRALRIRLRISIGTSMVWLTTLSINTNSRPKPKRVLLWFFLSSSKLLLTRIWVVRRWQERRVERMIKGLLRLLHHWPSANHFFLPKPKRFKVNPRIFSTQVCNQQRQPKSRCNTILRWRVPSSLPPSSPSLSYQPTRRRE